MVARHRPTLALMTGAPGAVRSRARKAGLRGGWGPVGGANEETWAAKRSTQELLDTAVEDSRRRCSGTPRFGYQLPTEALWQLGAMCHDQRFTNLLCRSRRRGGVSGFPGPR